MGCDIHSVIQVNHPDYGFVSVQEGFSRRSYPLFSFLAGVREVHGIAPIVEPRGLPSDVIPNHSGHIPIAKDFRWNDLYSTEWNRYQWEFWLGEHSFSWLRMEEMEAHFQRVRQQLNVADVEEYDAVLQRMRYWGRKYPHPRLVFGFVS